MKSKSKSWLEETWEIKKQIAQETKNMGFKEYWKYITQLSNMAKKGLIFRKGSRQASDA